VCFAWHQVVNFGFLLGMHDTYYVSRYILVSFARFGHNLLLVLLPITTKSADPKFERLLQYVLRTERDTVRISKHRQQSPPPFAVGSSSTTRGGSNNNNSYYHQVGGVGRQQRTHHPTTTTTAASTSSSSSFAPADAAAAAAEIGVLGFHPETGAPLTRGTIAHVATRRITYGMHSARNNERIIATSFKGQPALFQLVGDPWLDPTGSFHLAHVEVFFPSSSLSQQQQQLPLSPSATHYSRTTMKVGQPYSVWMAAQRRLEIDAERLFCTLPSMVEEWTAVLFEQSIMTPAALRNQLKEVGPMPHTKGERAIWVVAALLNPIQEMTTTTTATTSLQQQQQHQSWWRQRVCEEIRPALLACQNDHDRLVLAATALQSSMDLIRRQQGRG
jgi:hypothetical protein